MAFVKKHNTTTVSILLVRKADAKGSVSGFEIAPPSKGDGTTQAVLDVIEHIYDNIYSNNHSGVITLDLKKAFDTVNHILLLHKLEHYGIRVLGNKLLRSCLSNRIQAVSVNGKMSSFKPIRLHVAFPKVLFEVLSYFQFISTIHPTLY